MSLVDRARQAANEEAAAKEAATRAEIEADHEYVWFQVRGWANRVGVALGPVEINIRDVSVQGHRNRTLRATATFSAEGLRFQGIIEVDTEIRRGVMSVYLLDPRHPEMAIPIGPQILSVADVGRALAEVDER